MKDRPISKAAFRRGGKQDRGELQWFVNERKKSSRLVIFDLILLFYIFPQKIEEISRVLNELAAL